MGVFKTGASVSGRRAAAAAVLLWAALAAGLQGCGGGSDGASSGTANPAASPAPKVVSTVQVTPSGGTVPYGGTQQFTASVTYSDGSTAALSTGVTWSAAPTSVVTVTSAGVATGRLSGTATVSAAFGGVTGSAACPACHRALRRRR